MAGWREQAAESVEGLTRSAPAATESSAIATRLYQPSLIGTHGPIGPCSSNATTQSRPVWSPTLPSAAACHVQRKVTNNCLARRAADGEAAVRAVVDTARLTGGAAFGTILKIIHA